MTAPAIDQMCEENLLIGFDSQPLQRGTDGKWARTVVLLQGTQAIPKLALPVMSQEALVLAFCKPFPASWFSNFKFAMVEDLTSLMAPRSAHTQHGWPDPTHGIRCSEAASTDWGRVPRAALVALVRLPPLN